MRRAGKRCTGACVRRIKTWKSRVPRSRRRLRRTADGSLHTEHLRCEACPLWARSASQFLTVGHAFTRCPVPSQSTQREEREEPLNKQGKERHYHVHLTHKEKRKRKIIAYRHTLLVGVELFLANNGECERDNEKEEKQDGGVCREEKHQRDGGTSTRP